VSRLRLAAAGVLLLGLAAPRLATAQTPAATTYVAFGDSITFGTGDQPNGGGYPARLQALLQTRGLNAMVRNAGLPGETTAEGVTRITTAVHTGDSVLLLMEGTNDVGTLSPETVAFNLSEIARKAALRGLTTLHATPPPRLPSAANDGNNRITESFAEAIRELAFSRQRNLADPFEVFFHLTPNFTSLYTGGIDKVHPNAAGYDLMARVFADVLTNVDSVPPVTGLVDPYDDEQNVRATSAIQVDLYDFGAGIDLTATRLLVNGQEVVTPISGTPRKIEIRYTPAQPFVGVIAFGIRSRDLATPPHTIDRTLSTFVVLGTTFLRGDIDRNGRVDGVDLLAFAPRFGARTPDPRFRTFADLNGDGVVDGQDLAILAANFGRTSF
jgi:acyl-CoA thioesterase-1